MNRYFVEFEFKSNMGNRYWLPLLIEANNDNEANETWQRIKTSFSEHYEVLRSAPPKLYIQGINSELIDEYIDGRYSGKVETLEVAVWKFKDVNPSPELNFNQSIELIDLEEKKFDEDKDIAQTISRHKFPVRVISKNQDIDDFEEFNLINVVAPKFINKLIGAFKNRRV